MRIKRIVLKVLFGASVIGLAGFGGIRAYNDMSLRLNWWYSDIRAKYFSEKVKLITLQPQEKSVAQLIKESSRDFGVPKLLITAVIEQESGNKFRTDRVRFEPHLLKRVKREKWMNDIEYQLRASSIGLMQVVVFIHQENPNCSQNIQELFQVETNIRCGTSILKDCLNRHVSKPPVERVKQALICYNGSEAYAEEVFSRIAKLAIEGII